MSAECRMSWHMYSDPRKVDMFKIHQLTCPWLMPTYAATGVDHCTHYGQSTHLCHTVPVLCAHSGDQNSELRTYLFSHTIHVQLIFTYSYVQNNGWRRPPLIQTKIFCWHGATQMRHLYAHVYIMCYIGMCIYTY